MEKETKKTAEQAADDYAFQVPYNGTNQFYNKDRLDGFLAGAKWQAAQFQQPSAITEQPLKDSQELQKEIEEKRNEILKHHTNHRNFTHEALYAAMDDFAKWFAQFQQQGSSLSKTLQAIKNYVKSLDTPENEVYQNNSLLIMSCFSKAMEIIEENSTPSSQSGEKQGYSENEVAELKRLAHQGLPDDCVKGWDEVKFCEIRQGDGNQCKWCSNYND